MVAPRVRNPTKTSTLLGEKSPQDFRQPPLPALAARQSGLARASPARSDAAGKIDGLCGPARRCDDGSLFHLRARRFRNARRVRFLARDGGGAGSLGWPAAASRGFINVGGPGRSRIHCLLRLDRFENSALRLGRCWRRFFGRRRMRNDLTPHGRRGEDRLLRLRPGNRALRIAVSSAAFDFDDERFLRPPHNQLRLQERKRINLSFYTLKPHARG
jgi:hypothetical protein